MSTGDWQGGEEPDIGARCLIICREVLFDAGRPDTPYSLNGLLTEIRPRGHFPLVLGFPVSLFVEYFGQAGEYEVWIDLVRLTYDDDSGVVLDAVEEASYGPFVLNLLPDLFVQSRWYYLRKVPITEPGLHEFRLRVAGVSDPLYVQRLFVRG